MEFSGNFSAFPLGDLLQWIRNDQRTGTVVVRRSTREKRILFLKGDVVACTSDISSEFFGRHLLLHGKVSEEGLQQALRLCADQGKRLGDALASLDLMTEEEIQQALRSHIQDAVCDLFTWKRGVFYFEEGEPPDERILPAPLDTMQLAMEGARWSDEHARIRKVFVNDEVVLRNRSSLPPDDLDPFGMWIIQTVDGVKSLSEVHRELGGTYLRFLRTAFDLCMREVLDIAKLPETSPSTKQPTQELDIRDLLASEPQKERETDWNGAIQLDRKVLDRMVPVWIGRPLPDPRLKSLCLRFDGSATLGDLLGDRPEEELEFVNEALLKGRLALLPLTFDQLEDAEGGKKKLRWWQRLRR